MTLKQEVVFLLVLVTAQLALFFSYTFEDAQPHIIGLVGIYAVARLALAGLLSAKALVSRFGLGGESRAVMKQYCVCLY